ncbi:MAG TPA: thioredoxin domain-containing protein [Chloroflexota bacterium]|nr:thioredoxin domain-containing protein [Chloroflexota bacterium]
MSASTQSDLKPPVGDRDHALGPVDATVTFVEYGDFECGDTIRAYPMIKRVRRELGDSIRFVFRNYPLVDTHPRAMLAAEAAEAAGIQGKYWEMHDRIFEHPYALDRDVLVRHAGQIGLDVERFESDLKGHMARGRVEEDLASAKASHAPGTPTFYINGRRHTGSDDDDALLGALRDEIDS